MILVTGATGHLGKAVINFLIQKGTPITNIAALVRDEAKAADLKAKGIALKIGDYDNYASLVNAFKGVDQLVLISGTDIEKRSEQQVSVVKAAKEAGVKHIYYTSFERKNETTSSPITFIAQSHIDTEKAMKGSGLAYTIFRNNLYLDVLPMFLGEKVLETGIYFPAGETKGAYASRNDMAEAIANVVISEGHDKKEYAISNTEEVTFPEIAGYVQQITGKNIPYISPDANEYTAALNNAGVPAMYVGMFAGFAEAIRQGEFTVTKTDLENLLGRKPQSAKEFLSQVYAG